MEEEKRAVERQTAKIVSIGELNTGKYVKKDGWEPNYVLTKRNEKISRANIISVVVTIPNTAESIFIDDGSGKIEVRSFENPDLFKNVTVGDIVMLIGRPREFNNQIYVNGEILKKINNKGWLEYRKKEITLKKIHMPEIQEVVETQPELEEDNTLQESKEMDEIEEILLKIKELDDGNGCEVNEIYSNYPNGEEIVEQLLLKGEIFEMSPGKVKVLE